MHVPLGRTLNVVTYQTQGIAEARKELFLKFLLSKLSYNSTFRFF